MAEARLRRARDGLKKGLARLESLSYTKNWRMLPLAVFGLALIVGAVLIPLWIALKPSQTTPSEFWRDLASALGFGATSLFGVLFLLTARFKGLSLPFGIDLVYYFHRYIAMVALSVAGGHVVIASAKALMDASFRADVGLWSLATGIASMATFVFLAVHSFFRQRMSVPYLRWRRFHAWLAPAAYVVLIAHLILAHSTFNEFDFRRAFLLLLLLGLASVPVLWVRVLRPWHMSRRPWTLTKIEKQGGRHLWVTLEAGDGNPLSFAPGQFVWLSLCGSAFHLDEHPFSVASTPRQGRGNRKIRLAIQRQGDFTNMLASLALPCKAWIDGPYGRFTVAKLPHEHACVLIAGGIGMAPLFSMVSTLIVRRVCRDVTLFYAASTEADLVFRDDLEKMEMANNRASKKHTKLTVVYFLSQDAPPGWSGETGRIDSERLNKYLRIEGLHDLTMYRDKASSKPVPREYFLCGPPRMTDSVHDTIVTLGVSSTRIHTELFAWV
jgi:predicted ferric reductase